MILLAAFLGTDSDTLDIIRSLSKLLEFDVGIQRGMIS